LKWEDVASLGGTGKFPASIQLQASCVRVPEPELVLEPLPAPEADVSIQTDPTEPETEPGHAPDLPEAYLAQTEARDLPSEPELEPEPEPEPELEPVVEEPLPETKEELQAEVLKLRAELQQLATAGAAAEASPVAADEADEADEAEPNTAK
jgi:hypothetical protein